MNHFASNLKLIREDVLGISRIDLANFIGGDVSYSKIQNYEEGKTLPKDPVVRQFAVKFGINPTDLVNKKLTKKDVPVIVINQQASNDDALLAVVETQKKQIEQQQKVIELLMEQLKREA